MTTETILLIIGLIIFSIMLITFFMPCPDDFNITFSIDISGKRNVVYKDYIDETIIAIHKNESSLMDYYDKAKVLNIMHKGDNIIRFYKKQRALRYTP